MPLIRLGSARRGQTGHTILAKVRMIILHIGKNSLDHKEKGCSSIFRLLTTRGRSWHSLKEVILSKSGTFRLGMTEPNNHLMGDMRKLFIVSPVFSNSVALDPLQKYLAGYVLFQIFERSMLGIKIIVYVGFHHIVHGHLCSVAVLTLHCPAPKSLLGRKAGNPHSNIDRRQFRRRSGPFVLLCPIKKL